MALRSTVPCKGCGTMCLEDEPPETCNVCDPIISRLIAEAAENPMPESDEVWARWYT